MKPMKNKFQENLRIIWAITAKDIVDALKNKTTLAVILSALFVVALYRVMPYLVNRDDPLNVLVYDVGNSNILEPLDGSSGIKAYYKYPSQEAMENDLANGWVPELGLVIPPDFEQRLKDSEEVELDGYVLHWVSESDAEEIKSQVEEKIGELVGKPVDINLEGNTVHALPDSFGPVIWGSLSLVYVITMTGLPMVPHLMLEEKRTKTIEALLISPASSGQVTIAKALTGLFYCLVAASVTLIAFWSLVTHWGVIIMAVICGSLFAVGVGLLLGSIFETRQQFTIWAWVAIIPLLLPLFLVIMEELLPGGLITVFKWIPTVALARVLRVSFSEQAPLAAFGPELALLLGCSMLLLSAVAWVVRRSDR